MTSTIIEIFYSLRGKYDTHNESEEYFKLLRNYNSLTDELLKCKPKERESLLYKLDDAYACLESQVASSQFINGFKLGLLIGIEAAGE